MTSKQLTKLARSLGWQRVRNGGNHMIYKHDHASRPITIPYKVRGFVGVQITKQLKTVRS